MNGSEDVIAKAIRQVANGDRNGPTGLELVAMAMSRDADMSVSSALLVSRV